MNYFKKIISLITAVPILMVSSMIPSVAQAADNTPETPLYLFRDTLENYAAGLSVTGETYGTSAALVDGIWETSSTFGGAGKHNKYGIYIEDYIQYNKVIGLTPSVRSGGDLCVLNLTKELPYAQDYIYTTDMKISNNMAGIRLTNFFNDTAYYELAIVPDDNGLRTRFTKVADAVYDTPSVTDEWLYVDYSDSLDIANNTWLTLSLAKKDNTIYWSVYNKTTAEPVSHGSYEDTTPLFTIIGRLQLFAYGAGKTNDLTLFDNIDAKKLGAKLFSDNFGHRLETSWINESETPPFIATANYNKEGKLLSVRTFENKALNTHVFKGYPGYAIYEIPITFHSNKLFIWDKETLTPLYDAVTTIDTITDPVIHEVPADKYVYQSSVAPGSRFEDNGIIGFKNHTPVEVSPNAILYVNGYEYTSHKISNALLDKFLGNSQGVIRFEKTRQADTGYSKIYVDYYMVGRVKSVNYMDGVTTVSFKPTIDDPVNYEFNIYSLFTIKISDNAISNGVVNISTKKNGLAVDLRELKVDDVIAVAVDYNKILGCTSLSLTDPDYIKILATDETIKGMVVDYDDLYKTYTIGENTYKYVGYTGQELSVSCTYELPLDPFGRIIERGEKVGTTDKFAILEKYSNDRVTLVLADGSRAIYDLFSGDGSTYMTSAQVSTLLTTYVPAKDNIQNRVVKYSVYGDEVRLTSVAAVSPVTAKFNPSLGKLGLVTVEDGVNFIDASNYDGNPSSYAKFDVSDFVAQTEYTYLGFKVDNFYSFVIFTAVGKDYTEESRFAVLIENVGSKMSPDGESVYGAKAMYNGEETVLYWENNPNLAAGSVIFFKTNSEGFISEQYVIYNKSAVASLSNFSSQTTKYDTTDWTFDFNPSSAADIRLVSGVVVDVTSNAITFGVADEYGMINYANVDMPYPLSGSSLYTFGIADDCQAYEYDSQATGRESAKYSVTSGSAIIESNLVETSTTDVYDINDAGSLVTNAVALIVNGDVVCIFAVY